MLLMLGFFGLLVMTATPVHMIPTRLRETRDHLLHRGSGRDGRTTPRPAGLARAEDAAEPRRRGAGASPEGQLAGDEAFEQAASRRPGQGPAPRGEAPDRPGVLAPVLVTGRDRGCIRSRTPSGLGAPHLAPGLRR